MNPLNQRTAIAVLVTLALAGCAGGSSTSKSTSSATVQGVSTPSSVSVVTAQNAD
jgi:hypothetical protein